MLLTVDQALAQSQSLVQTTLNRNKSALGPVLDYLSLSSGKGLRSLLLLTCATDKLGRVHPDAIRAAAAIELLHLATLVHDDVIDDSDTRRGLSSLHKKFDTKTAIICGDYLLAISLSMLTEIDHKRIITPENHLPLAPKMIKTLSSLALGELIQHKNLGNTEIDLFTYLKIISGKTASLFYVSAYIGSVLANDMPAHTKKIANFGRYLGMAFQISDDCKDYNWTSAQAGKPVSLDPQNGVMSLPIVLAMRKNPKIKDLLKTLTPQNATTFVKAVINAEGTTGAEKISKKYAKKAQQFLEHISPEKKEHLLKLTQRLQGGY